MCAVKLSFYEICSQTTLITLFDLFSDSDWDRVKTRTIRFCLRGTASNRGSQLLHFDQMLSMDLAFHDATVTSGAFSELQ